MRRARPCTRSAGQAADLLGDAADGRRHDRDAGRERLEDGRRQVLGLGGVEVQVGGREVGRDLGRRRCDTARTAARRSGTSASARRRRARGTSTGRADARAAARSAAAATRVVVLVRAPARPVGREQQDRTARPGGPAAPAPPARSAGPEDRPVDPVGDDPPARHAVGQDRGRRAVHQPLRRGRDVQPARSRRWPAWPASSRASRRAGWPGRGSGPGTIRSRSASARSRAVAAVAGERPLVVEGQRHRQSVAHRRQLAEVEVRRHGGCGSGGGPSGSGGRSGIAAVPGKSKTSRPRRSAMGASGRRREPERSA